MYHRMSQRLVAEEVAQVFLAQRATVVPLALLDLLERMDLRVIREIVDLPAPKALLGKVATPDPVVPLALLERTVSPARSVLRVPLA